MRVVGAGVGRTGTHSLKIALERLLGGPCHHMVEMGGDPAQVPGWIDAIEGRPVDWPQLLTGYRAIVDWPGASFWREISAAFPNALVLLSVRDPEAWYRSASNTIFLAFDRVPPPERVPWLNAVRKLLHDRFGDQFDDPTAMMDAFQRHNDAVRRGIPAARLLEWRPEDGWEPICGRLGLPVPDDPFPMTNTTNEARAAFGMPPVDATG
jgi:Sulfotransferase domain